MATWLFMCAGLGLIPFSLLLFGWLFLKQPPETINNSYGYRTKRSMQNQETWLFAHHHCGRLWEIIGIILFILTVGILVYFRHQSNQIQGIVSIGVFCVQLFLLILSVYFTEKALEKRFKVTHSNQKEKS